MPAPSPPRVGEVVGAAAVLGSEVSRSGQTWAKRCSGRVGYGARCAVWPVWGLWGRCGLWVVFFLGLHFGGFRCMAVAYFDADAKQGKS